MLKNIKQYLIKNIFRNMESYDINMEELKQKQTEGAIIIDVRATQEFKEGHIEGAINIPYYNICKKANSILLNQDNEIIVYCEAGSRSRKAYKTLKKMGYSNVYNLYGGIENWT